MPHRIKLHLQLSDYQHLNIHLQNKLILIGLFYRREELRSTGPIGTTIEASGIPYLTVPSQTETSAEIAMEIDLSSRGVDKQKSK